MPRQPGKFIVLDGPDGCGKSTQAALLHDALKLMGLDVIVVRDPGGTQLGEQVRKTILDPANTKMTIKTELFLYMASRSQLVDEVIAPAIKRGTSVIADRFLSSSIAYQGVAGGLGMERVMEIGDFCIAGHHPDLTILLDVDINTGLERRKEEPDRIEARDIAFHEAVREGFLALASTGNPRIKLVDAHPCIETVHREIKRLVLDVI